MAWTKTLLALMLLLGKPSETDGQTHYGNWCFGDYISFQVETRSMTCEDNVRYSIDPEGDALPATLMLDPITGVISGVFRPDWTRYIDDGEGSRRLQTGQTYRITLLVTDVDSGFVQEEVDFRMYRAECDMTVISNFVIVDTKRNADVRPMIDDDVINLGWLKDRFSIRAVVFPEYRWETFHAEYIVDKVEFILDGKKIRTEKYPPYALGGDKTGDNKWGDFWPFVIREGKHKLTAIPYDMEGKSGEAKTVTFTITECRGGYCE